MSNAPDGFESMPSAISLYDQAREAADAVARVSPISPRVGVILGSGLGALADAVETPTTVPYSAIPHLIPPTVAGHDGRLTLGMLAGVPIAVMQGRTHLYEGYPPQRATMPVRMLKLLGVEVCVLTNAAGGLDPSLTPGSLMLIRDHISLPTLAGLNPLFGPNDERFGPRFPAMTDAYDPALRQLAAAAARRHNVHLAEGVYAMVSGPSFETPAELRMLRLLGADAVGMSTVPEVIVARHMSLRVLALSCITNQALAESASQEIPDHEQVLQSAAMTTGRLTTIVSDVLAHLV